MYERISWRGLRFAGAATAIVLLAVPQGGCGSGGSAGTSAELVMPIERNGKYVLELGQLTFAIEPAGARVVDVHLSGGTNLLTGAALDSIAYGATFWTSPQGTWGWPPPDEIDSKPYTPTVAVPSVSFAGATSALVGAAIFKRFTADLANSRIVATYEITAQGGDGMFAPWEITRVFPGGLTFFPTGSGAPKAGGGFDLPPTQNAAGCTWYQHPGGAPGADQKLLADGAEGWLAHVAGNTVIVKKFADVPAGMAAPDEAEIEIFVQGAGGYVEVEEQGAYQRVPQGSSLTWPVTWIVRTLPAGLSPTLGDPALVQFVQSLVRP